MIVEVFYFTKDTNSRFVLYIRSKYFFMFRFTNTSSFNQLIILFIITLASWLIISISATFIGSLIWNFDLADLAQQVSLNHSFARYFQITQSLALFVFPPLIFSLATQEHPFNWLRFINPDKKNIVLAVLVVIIAQPFVSYLGYLNSNIHFPEYLSNLEDWIKLKEENAMEMTKIFLDTSGWFLVILNVVIIAIIPAIGEELLFRGALQKLFTAITKNYHISIFITAFLFSAMHMQFFGFFPRFILGVIFGYLVVYGKSIWLSIAAHFTNNFTAFLIYNISTSRSSVPESNPLEISNTSPDLTYAILSTLGVIAIIIYLGKRKEVI